MVDLLSAVTNKLYSLFPNIPINVGQQGPTYEFDNYTIHENKDTLEVETPCFFVFLVESELDRQFANRFFLYNTININYASGEEESIFDLEQVRLKMLTGMEMIELTDDSLSTETELGPRTAGISGNNIKTEIVDKDIIMTIDYNIWLEYIDDDIPYMKILDENFTSEDKVNEEDIVGNEPEELEGKIPDSEIDYMRIYNHNIRTK